MKHTMDLAAREALVAAMAKDFVPAKGKAKNKSKSRKKSKASKAPNCKASDVPTLGEAAPSPSKLWFAVFVLSYISLQVAISMGSYSGFNDPPMFGDFEAQRHWMEITTELPLAEWYANSPSNNLSYWGLDYPPLTAYHSYVVGRISHFINPSWTALNTSRGITDEHHKLFMRLSVIVTNVLFYLPALWMLLGSAKKPTTFFFAAFYPGLLLIDNGHFQYNHISLGFFLWAIVFFTNTRPLIGSIAFVLALNFKQMELYHSLPIFIFLLSRCMKRKSFLSSIYHLLCIGSVVLGTFAVLWAPFIWSNGGVLQVMKRVFPFERGLFEDKVANAWCVLSVVVKFKEIFSLDELKVLSGAAVLIASIPSLSKLFMQPTIRQLKYALSISSLTFFLFSFQVHEKSILLAALPMLLILNEEWTTVTIFLTTSVVSMFPLLLRDGIRVTLPVTMLYHCSLVLGRNYSTLRGISVTTFVIVAGAICAAEVAVEPPAQYPHLWPLINAGFSFSVFSLILLRINWSMYVKKEAK
ncbi:hypothetical protein L596_001370 [Steinernema carpocapsae]|uniref:Alpha-1,3-glucosyltransferase n=1 Tax=Steinernema carpocapsae TaxID=34508 RepID=A0A4V6I7D3_STECR|nr:hypothetical protein L596_001370 [Steinernema carpocapsae]